MADAVGLLASAIVSQVGAKLGSAIGDQVTMLCSFKDDLEDMKETLLSLAEVLKDAERRSIKEMSVRLWLKRLKNAAYDISDMLDQFQEDSKHATVKVYMLTIDHQYFFFYLKPNISLSQQGHLHAFCKTVSKELSQTNYVLRRQCISIFIRMSLVQRREIREAPTY